MANEMPRSERYTGLARKVLEYSEHFQRIVHELKKPGGREADWGPLETLVDVRRFRRLGVFLTGRAEVSDWPQYKRLITEYGGMTAWEGTLRRITEVHGLVFLELEERNTRDGVTDVSNTVTIYEFDADERLVRLDVYVAHLERRGEPSISGT
jgi:hypothetical protein